jgi:A/G-specific adenine glycosylase
LKILIINKMDSSFFSSSLLKWYVENRRHLPWRTTTDPYRIWLAEIILQQTRVQQGLPYYERFVQTFPDVFALAQAPTEKVLRLWQGLGYYTRARNLHACAQAVVQQHHGIFPSRYEELLQLPGIGPYTAAAIASIAFGQPVAVLDGNVYRVLARFLSLDTPTNSPTGKKVFSELAQQLLNTAHPGEHNQAVMELGALICTPKNPGCTKCPLSNHCQAFHQRRWNQLPVKNSRKKPRTRYLYYLVFAYRGKIYMRKRTSRDIWQGLYDFYCVETSRPQRPEKILQLQGLGIEHTASISPAYRHQLTHQLIVARFIAITNFSTIPDGAGLRPYSPLQAAKLPKPVLINRYLSDTGFL